MAFVQCFIGTCIWLLLSEILPMTIRGFAMGIALFVLVPETRGRSPEELEDGFREHDPAHDVHTAAAAVHGS